MSTTKTKQAEEFNAILDPINDIASEVIEERLAQLEKWGEQTRPSHYDEVFRLQFSRAAERWKEINDARESETEVTWDGVLLEEVYEALAEEDPQRIRAELIQVAAVAMAWVQDLDDQEQFRHEEGQRWMAEAEAREGDGAAA